MLTTLRCDKALLGWTVVLEARQRPETLPLRMRFANFACPVHFSFKQTANKMERALLRVSPNVFGSLMLPESTTSLHIDMKAKVWRLGPCLGLYADSFEQEDRMFGEQTQMFRDLARLAALHGLVLLFIEPGYSDGERAYFYDSETKKFKPVCGYHPDIVYRRSGTFRQVHLRHVQKDLRTFREANSLHSLPIESGNKWTLYQLLSNGKDIADHLPFTTRAVDWKKVYEQVLKRHDVYVKPLGGAQGISIYRLVRDTRGAIVATWEEREVPRSQERLTNQFHPKTKILHRELRDSAQFKKFFIQTGLKRCIVQDTVKLMTYQGNPCDFRWLVVDSDEPKIIARVARVAQGESITTNIHTGSTAKDAVNVLSAFSEVKQKQILSQMDALAIKVVRILHNRYGPFVETGVDLAVTSAGEVKAFEINPTPGRRMLRALEPRARQLSLEELLEYAIKATGYVG